MIRQGRVMVPAGSDAEKRAAMQAGGFRNANPWSMTVEEWGEQELRMQAEKALAAAEQAEQKKEIDGRLTAEEREQIKRDKDEGWAEFKEANPFGSGNKGDNYFKR
mmetsp:Transcript_3982/g.11535  ORF Transcript_3982/g.11535 Transcript_3982/m.11535 type:complete len:106 (-) Transcript_3982:259-576(-)